MKTLTATQTSLVLRQMTEDQKRELSQAFLSFIETASVGTARASFYNTQAEQVQAIDLSHQKLLNVDRSIYGMSLLLPGFTDYTKQLGVVKFLGNHRMDAIFLDESQEKRIIQRLLGQLSVPRKLKLFAWLKKEKINNARTRKLILNSILSEKHLERWVSKYKTKIATTLEHAWGKRMCSIIKAILSKPASKLSLKEKNILKVNVLKYSPQNYTHIVLECVSFALSVERVYNLPLLKSYQEAKSDLMKGSKLSFEVLEGIRSTYHPESTTAQVLELTKKQLTKGQKIAFQAQATKAQVDITFNPKNYDCIRLYIYAFKQGLTDDITEVLAENAAKTARGLPLQFEKVGILLDTSLSMQGSETQWMRPMAISLAIRDVIRAASEETILVGCGDANIANKTLVETQGDTSLAQGLLELMEAEVDTIFILSDGYENSPAGRVNEVMQLSKKIGVNIPVLQVTPVLAAEAGGIRKLSDAIGTIPISQVNGLGVNLLKSMFEVDVEQGIEALFNTTMPLINQ